MKYILLFISAIATNISIAQYKDTLLAVNGTKLYIKEAGTGSPIIVVHGGPGLNHSYFLPHLASLAKKHRLIFYDQRACGNSSGNLDSTQMNLHLFVEDIEAIRNNLNLGKILILAHSWGGLVAMKYASKYSNNINSLILSNSVSPKFGEFEKETNLRLKVRIPKEDSILLTEILKSPEFKSGNLEAYTRLFKLSFKPSFYYSSSLEKFQLLLPSDFLNKRKVLFFMSKELSAYDFYEELKNISCNTLIIHGDYDGMPLELSKKIHANITNSKLAIIKNAGHFPFVDRPKEYVNVITQFLKKTKS
jgi:proline iminopeptidase